MITKKELEEKYSEVKEYNDEYLMIGKPITINIKVTESELIYKKEGDDQYTLIESPVILPNLKNDTFCILCLEKNISDAFDVSNYTFPKYNREVVTFTFDRPKSKNDVDNIINNLKEEIKKLENMKLS